MGRARLLSLVASVLAAVAVLAPVATRPAAAAGETADFSVTASGPTSPVQVGDLFTVTFAPQVSDAPADAFPTFTVTYELPSNVELYDTRSFRSTGTVDCTLESRTVTCTDWTFSPWQLRLLAVAPGEVTSTFAIAGNLPDPDPDPTPNTASVTTTVEAATKDVTVAPTYEPAGTVGEPLTLSLTIYDGTGAATPPTYTVDGAVTWTIPDELLVTGARVVPAFDSNQDAISGPYFGPGSCTVAGQDVTCDGLTIRADFDFVQVDVVPLAAGTWPVSATFAPGPHQAEPDPDPSPNSATWDASVTAATAGSIVGRVDGTLAPNPIADAVVEAYPVDSPTAAATATTGATGSFSLTALDPGDYVLSVTPPEASQYLPQWWRSDGVASERTFAGTLTVPSSGDPVVVGVTVQDLDLGRIDLGAGSRSFDETDQALYAGERGEVVLQPGWHQRRVDGVLNDLPAHTTYSLSVPASVDLLSATPRWGAGGGPDPGGCTVAPHEVACELTVGVPEVAVELVPGAPGSIPFTISHTSTEPEAVPNAIANTVELPVEVRAPDAGLTAILRDPATGSGLAGVTVRAYLPGDGFLPDQPAATVTTDGTGRFTLTGLTAGDYRLLAVPPSGSDLPAQWLIGGPPRVGADVFALEHGTTPDVGTIDLVEDRVITGQVTAGGSPVEGVQVRAFATGVSWLPSATAVTGADGTYALHGLATGTYEVLFGAPTGSGLADSWYEGAVNRITATPVSVSTSGVVSGIDGQLESAGTVQGAVAGPGGSVAGAQVVLFSPSDGLAGSHRTITGSDGSYEIQLPPGTYRVRVVPPQGSGLGDEWFQDATSRATASPVVVTGASTSEVDVLLGAAPS